MKNISRLSPILALTLLSNPVWAECPGDRLDPKTRLEKESMDTEQGPTYSSDLFYLLARGSQVVLNNETIQINILTKFIPVKARIVASLWIDALGKAELVSGEVLSINESGAIILDIHGTQRILHPAFGVGGLSSFVVLSSFSKKMRSFTKTGLGIDEADQVVKKLASDTNILIAKPLDYVRLIPPGSQVIVETSPQREDRTQVVTGSLNKITSREMIIASSDDHRLVRLLNHAGVGGFNLIAVVPVPEK